MNKGNDYQASLVPRKADGQALDVDFKIRIVKIPHISTFEPKMTVDFFVTMKWRDYRLSYNGLKDDYNLNILDQNRIRRIWTPQVRFKNALGALNTEDDPPSIGSIMKESKPLEYDLSNVHESKFRAGYFLR